MISQVDVSDFVPSRYQIKYSNVVTVIGRNILVTGDQMRCYLKIQPVNPIAVADTNYYFGQWGPNAFRWAFNSNNGLDIDWINDGLLVCQQVLVNDNAGANNFTIMEIQRVPGVQDNAKVRRNSLAAIYAKVQNSSISFGWNTHPSYGEYITR